MIRVYTHLNPTVDVIDQGKRKNQGPRYEEKKDREGRAGKLRIEIIHYGDGNWKSYRSKEDKTQSISQSILVTKFLDHVTTHDLWKVCNDYGVIVDAFIPYKKSKAGKRFGFVRFIKVDNIDRIVTNLCTIWIGRFHLHANVARFRRERKPSAPSHPSNAHERNSPGSYVSILKSGKTNNVMSDRVLPSLIFDDSCISDRDFSLSLMGKVKDITVMPNLYVILEKECFQNLSLTYLGGLWVLIQKVSISAKEKLLNHISVGSWFSSLKPACNSFVSNERVIWISLEGLPLKVWTRNTLAKVTSKWGDHVEWEDLAEKSIFCKRLCVKTKLNEIIVELCKVIVKGSVYWVCSKEICNDSYVSEIADDEVDEEDDGSQSRDKVTTDNDVERASKSSCMHNNDLLYDNNHNNIMYDKDKVIFEDPFNLYDILNKRKDIGDDLKYPHGFTSSVINMEEVNKKVKGATSNKEPTLFVKDNVTLSDNFLAVMGTWVPSSSKLLIISIYALQDLIEKRVLWDYILHLID
ncbi:RNA-directed DNA polymerase, eukaryota, nucleotide-binding alpha-beta plait domain protein [Tanacetum coccineum]|uniref:RNA-directed DNA polymerase, eukaryota, nucleotide-binding alpha-beta plait domain protein n=1 Tax=Tanacetum coccineum TaxID=301880 RepID=A0ABQ5EZK9_9ASTR